MEIQRESRLCIGRKDSIKTQTPGERKIEMTAHSFLVSHWCLYRHLAWHLWLYHSVCMSFVHCQAVDPGGRTCVLITFEPQPLLNVELGSTQKELLNEWEKKVKSRRWKWFSSSSFFFSSHLVEKLLYFSWNSSGYGNTPLSWAQLRSPQLVGKKQVRASKIRGGSRHV